MTTSSFSKAVLCRRTGEGAVGRASVALLARVGRDHEYDLFLVIDDIEKPVRPDHVSPGFGFEALQLLDVRPGIGLLPELGIDKATKLRRDLFPPGGTDFLEVV